MADYTYVKINKDYFASKKIGDDFYTLNHRCEWEIKRMLNYKIRPIKKSTVPKQRLNDIQFELVYYELMQELYDRLHICQMGDAFYLTEDSKTFFTLSGDPWNSLHHSMFKKLRKVNNKTYPFSELILNVSYDTYSNISYPIRCLYTSIALSLYQYRHMNPNLRKYPIYEIKEKSISRYGLLIEDHQIPKLFYSYLNKSYKHIELHTPGHEDIDEVGLTKKITDYDKMSEFDKSYIHYLDLLQSKDIFNSTELSIGIRHEHYNIWHKLTFSESVVEDTEKVNYKNSWEISNIQISRVDYLKLLNGFDEISNLNIINENKKMYIGYINKNDIFELDPAIYTKFNYSGMRYVNIEDNFVSVLNDGFNVGDGIDICSITIYENVNDKDLLKISYLRKPISNVTFEQFSPNKYTTFIMSRDKFNKLMQTKADKNAIDGIEYVPISPYH